MINIYLPTNRTANTILNTRTTLVFEKMRFGSCIVSRNGKSVDKSTVVVRNTMAYPETRQKISAEFENQASEVSSR